MNKQQIEINNQFLDINKEIDETSRKINELRRYIRSLDGKKIGLYRKYAKASAKYSEGDDVTFVYIDKNNTKCKVFKAKVVCLTSNSYSAPAYGQKTWINYHRYKISYTNHNGKNIVASVDASQLYGLKEYEKLLTKTEAQLKASVNKRYFGY